MKNQLTDAQLEAMFGVTAKEIEENAKPWESGEVPGKATGDVQMGRPLKFGSALKSIGFKETEEKIAAIDARAASLGMARSDYLRQLVDKDLATAS